MAPSTRALLVMALFAGSASAGTADTCIDASEAGQVERDRGHFRAAKKLLQTCAKEGCPGEIRRDCATWLDALEKRVPSIVVRVVDAGGREVLDADVSIDGEKVAPGGIALPLDPGDKRIVVARAGRPIAEQMVRVVEGERARVVEVKLEEPTKRPEPSSQPAGPAASGGGVPATAYVLGGVGLLAAGGYAFFGLRAKSEVDDMRATCAPTCDAARVDSAKRDRNVATAFFAISALSLGGALYLTLDARSAAARGATTRVSVSAAPGGVGATFTAPF